MRAKYSITFHLIFRALKTSNVQNRVTLRQGIKLAELGVMNAVGSTKTKYFRNLNHIVKVMPVNLMSIPWYKLKDHLDKEETSLGKKKKDRKFLDRLAVDKHYLQGIIEKVSPTQKKSKPKKIDNNPATALIVSEAQDALDFLEERREFWSTQNPDYPNKQRVPEEEKPKQWDTVATRMGPQKISVFQHDLIDFS